MKLYYPGLAQKCRTILELLWQDMAEAAREHGYALTFHGSTARDIDLVAVPWTHGSCSKPAEVAEAIRAAAEKANPTGVCFEAPRDVGRQPERKPYGRLAWSFHLGGGPYLDLSVFPPILQVQEEP